MIEMKARKLSLRALWQKIRPRRKAPTPKPKPTARPARGIEPLEGRIAPATLVDASTLLYKDVDGDMVTVKFSKAIFDPASALLNATLDQVFVFSAGDAHGGTDTAQQLQLLDLSKAPVINFKNVASGASLTVTATKAGLEGDDRADVGAIKAGANDLGNVAIDGDLGQIDCGNSSSKIALRSLEVETFGAKELTTQTPVTATGAAGEAERAEKLESRITGAIGKLTVHGDMQGYLHAVNGTQFNGSQTVVVAPGKINEVTISGSLKGAATVESASNNTGSIDAASSIRKISIGTSLIDGIVGGGGTNSGSILSGDKLGIIRVSGDVLGGAGTGSGRISAAIALDSVSIGGTLTGGAAGNSGVVHCGGALKTVVVHSTVTAGKGLASGVILSDGTIGAVTINGNINGDVANAGARSGGISSAGKLGNVTINGSLIGGPTSLTGFIEGHSDVERLVINGNITGGVGVSSGTVSAGGKLSRVSVGAAVVGGAGENSASIFSGLDPAHQGVLQKVDIGDSLQGGAGASSGSIIARSGLASAVVGSSAAAGSGHLALQGGVGNFSGTIYSQKTVGSVKIVGTVVGGSGAHSGAIESTGPLQSVSMDLLTGGNGDFSGSIIAHDDLNAAIEKPGSILNVRVTGEVRGGQGFHAGTISADGSLGTAILGALSGGQPTMAGGIYVGTGAVVPGNAQKIVVHGAIDGTSIRVADALGSLLSGALTDALVSARGASTQSNSTDRAIGSVNIAGSVNGSQILAGYAVDGEAVNPDAQIGAVTVGGSWTASDLVAGIADLAGNGFANDDDRPIATPDNPAIISRIAAIRIAGAIAGTAGEGDHFGFVAEQILALTEGGRRVSLDKDAVDVDQLDLTNNDVSLREVSRT
jgi:hypothetical protein